MTETGSKYVTMKIDASTGTIVEVTDENGNKPTPVSEQEMKEIYNSKNGFKYITTVLFAHHSPGCVYYYFNGYYLKFCW